MMTRLLTSAQMRAVEAEAMASGRVTGLELMERAGRGVVEAMEAEWPELRAGGFRAVVLCGPGNNGGDGFVIARLLRERGWEVVVGLYGEPSRLPPDARVNHDRWCAMGGVLPLGDEIGEEVHHQITAFAMEKPNQPLHVIDALFGTGLRRSLKRDGHYDAVALVVDLGDLWMQGGPEVRIVAVDVPSGLCADSGRILEIENPEEPLHAGEITEEPRFFAIQAHLTITFHSAKLGHVLDYGPEMCGKLAIVDIGVPPAPPQRGDVEGVGAPQAGWVMKRQGHKFRHGHALVLGGCAGRGGAARLAARGALRVGAGLVTVGCPEGALAENAARLDAVMLRMVEDGAALEGVLEDGRITALCLGPGLGTGAREAGLVAAALRARRTPLQGRGEPRPPAVVLDADALTLLSQDGVLFAALHEGCVLTPHGGEFARLFPDIAERLAAPATQGPAYSKVDATRAAAARAGCVVLFKGADTVIANPVGQCVVHAAAYERAAPWLATAGSGDVLAGIITGLMARGFGPFQAACIGAWLHVEAAREFGPGLIAEDLPEMLPAVFRRLGV